MVNNQEYLEQLFRDFYYFEHDRKARINTDRSLPIVILTVISGILTYYAQNIPRIEIGIIYFLFISTVVGALICIVYSIFFLKKTFFNYDYNYVASPKELDIRALELHYHHTRYGAPNIEDAMLESIRDDIIYYYKESTNNNIDSNNQKQYDVNMSLKWLFIAIVFLIISMLPFYILNDNTDNIPKVEIIEQN